MPGQPRVTASMWLSVALVFLFGVLLRFVWRFGDGLTAHELAWLVRRPTLLTGIGDWWIGKAHGDSVMRLPFLLTGALAAPVVMLASLRVAGPVVSLMAGLVVASSPSLTIGSGFVGAEAPMALAAAGALAWAVCGKPRTSFLLLLCSLPALWLDPPLVVTTLGAAAGLTAARHERAARALGVVVPVLLLGFPLFSRKLPWYPGGGHGAAWMLEQALVLLMVPALVVAGRRGSDPASETSLRCAALGIGGLCSLWLIIPPLRALSLAPVTGLLVAAPVAVLSKVPHARFAGPTLAAALGLSFGALSVSNARQVTPLALAEAASQAGSELALQGGGEMVAGEGLSPGALTHVLNRHGLNVVGSPRAPAIARLSLAAQHASETQHRALAALIGERTLVRTGLAGSGDGAVSWAVYRPVRFRMQPGAPRPDIAIISVDTLRADHLSLYGYERETSPLLDRWSERAVVYERAIAPAAETAPSFASLLTGRLPRAHGIRSNAGRLEPGCWPLPVVLKKVGYDTAAFVSSSVLQRGRRGLEEGFDVYDDHLDRVELHRPNSRLRLAPSLAAAVEKWLEPRLGAEKPWLLWVHAMDPHGPYTPLPPFRSLFRSAKERIIPAALIPAYQRLGTLNFFDYLDAYDDEIRQTDAHLGPLLAKIRDHCSARGVLIVFVADHGEAFGEHGHYFQHGESLHREEVHVPLVLYDTRQPRSAREEAAVSLMDVFPTLLAALRLETDLPLDGMPLPRRTRQQEIVVAGWRPGEGAAFKGACQLMVDGRVPGAPRVELYGPRPLSSLAADRRDLLDAVTGLFSRDPLGRSGGEEIEKRLWQGLSTEELLDLRSLGYVQR